MKTRFKQGFVVEKVPKTMNGAKEHANVSYVQVMVYKIQGLALLKAGKGPWKLTGYALILIALNPVNLLSQSTIKWLLFLLSMPGRCQKCMR